MVQNLSVKREQQEKKQLDIGIRKPKQLYNESYNHEPKRDQDDNDRLYTKQSLSSINEYKQKHNNTQTNQSISSLRGINDYNPDEVKHSWSKIERTKSYNHFQCQSYSVCADNKLKTNAQNHDWRRERNE